MPDRNYNIARELNSLPELQIKKKNQNGIYHQQLKRKIV